MSVDPRRAAADRLLAAVAEHRSAERFPAPTAVTSALDALDRALGGESATAEAAAVREEVGRFLGRFTAYWEKQGAATARALTNAAPGRLTGLLDVALATFDGRAELDAAVADVRRLEDEHAEVLQQLDVAVQRADLAAVADLRPRLEVLLPRDLGRARVRVAQLQLARQEAQTAALDRRARDEEAWAAAAAAAAERARRAASEAETAAEVAKASAVNSRQRAGLADMELEASRTALKELAARTAADDQHRLRRLAGLDAPAAGRVVDAEPSAGLVRPLR